MKQDQLFDPVPRQRLETLSKEELIEFVELQQKVTDQFKREVERLSALSEELKQKTFLIEDEYIKTKNKLFGKSSEREPSENSKSGSGSESGSKRKRVQLPSER